MPTYSANQLLEALQQQTEFLLDTAVTRWQLIPHEVFSRRPADGGWSANECLQHLNSYSLIYLPAVEKAMEAAPPPDRDGIFRAGSLGHWFTRLMYPDEGRKMTKMKTPKNHNPAVIIDSSKVIAEFIDHNENMLKLLRAAGSVDIGKVSVPTSLSKYLRLKLGDTFAFLIAHELRHAQQAQRALGAEALPLPVSYFPERKTAV